MSCLEERYVAINQKIKSASNRFERRANDVSWMAVSKTRQSEELREAFACGIRDVGENYLQEALTKMKELEDLAFRWHFIGGLQSNKAKQVAEHFDWVHSVDRVKLVKQLSAGAQSRETPLNVCLQVNLDKEASKSGVSEHDLPDLIEATLAASGLCLRGLMFIPQARDSFEEQRAVFERGRVLFEQLQKRAESEASAQIDTLSMGMSADFEAAIASGATLLRIGTAFFGARR